MFVPDHTGYNSGHHVMSWWQWVRTSAESTHRIFLTKLFDQRERVFPQEPMPVYQAQVESWMRPRILACLPKILRDWVDLRATAGVVESSHTLGVRMKRMAYCEEFSIQPSAQTLNPLSSNLCAGARMCNG